MSDIVVEKRKSPLKIEFEERRRILFHIESLQGLPQPGWQPIASTFVSVEILETKESLLTEHKKSGPLIFWGENIPLQDLKDSSKVRFEIRSHRLWNKTVLGTTDTFDVRQLIQMQSQVGEDRDALINLVVTLIPPFNSPKSNGVILSLSIRETAVQNLNALQTASEVQRLVDKSRPECLEDLRQFNEKMVHLRMTFAEATDFLCLVDIILGTSEGVYKIIANPVTKNTSHLTVDCIKALNNAFAPYQSLSARQLAKRGEQSTAMMKEMLCGTIKALESVERVLRNPTHYHFPKHQLNLRQNIWTDYFEDCEKFLFPRENGEKVKPPKPPGKMTLRRIHCPYHMVVNQDLPINSNVLAMDLPITYTSGTYDRPDLVGLIAEWIYSPSFSDNGTSDSTKQTPNVFCLSGAPRCGKTQLASRMIYWLRELGSLGGFFSFDRDTAQTPNQLMDALPLTIIHQACTVQPDIVPQLSQAFSKNKEATSAVSLEDRFDKLFVTPLLEFDQHRGDSEWRAWNPLEPLVFVIDGLGSRRSVSRFADGTLQREEQVMEEERMLKDFVNFFSSRAVRRVPPYIKFLILCQSGMGIDRMFREKGVGFVCEMTPIVQYVETPLPSFASGSRDGYGSLSESSSGSGLTSSIPESE